jgi:hypothetical protein
MASPILPAPPAASPFYMNMARKRALMQQQAGAPAIPPAPVIPQPGPGGGTATQVAGNGEGYANALGGQPPPAPAPLEGGFAGGMRPPVMQPPGGEMVKPALAPPLDGGFAGGMRPPVPGNAPGPVSPKIPPAPPVMTPPGGDMGVTPATMAAEKKKAQGNFFKRRQPQIPTPTGPPVFQQAGQVIDR